MIDYEKTLLAAGEIALKDLVEAGLDQNALKAIEGDLETRRARIAQLEKVGVEILVDLDKGWEIQANNLADRFASELGMSRNQYMDGLPRFSPQPGNYAGRLERPTLVQVPTIKLTLARMLDVAGIVNYLELKNVKDWQQDPKKFKTPDKPYVACLHDGSRNKGRSVVDVRRTLLEDERGGTVYDGIALFIQDPDILKSHYLDLPGSQYGSVSAPDLGFWRGRPGLRCHGVGGADDDWGSVVAGR